MTPSKPQKGSGLAAFYHRIADFNVESLFVRKREPGPPRTIFVNAPLPSSYFDHKGRVQKQYTYPSNQVITSKYTVITFLPRNLLEQFRRVANIFFLFTAILQFFHTFSTITPGIAILPLAFIVIVTGAKDGYEDVKRHQSDRTVNHSKVRVLTGGTWINANAVEPKSKTFVRGLRRRHQTPSLGSRLSANSDVEYDSDDGSETLDYEKPIPYWRKTLWEDLRVGDIVKIMDNEPFPADILICATSEQDDVAFIETKNLDGETNLKSRHAAPALTHLRSAHACAEPRNAFQINCDRPATDMYRLNATVEVGGAASPVDLSMMLLRGTVLRNTRWVIGVVMYTGLDTKIVLNSGGTPSKRSKVERQMNPQVTINLTILAMLAFACAIGDSVLEHRYYHRGAPWLYDDNRSGDNPNINGLITFVFALLTFQAIVPISLYISIEFVRTCQAAFIYFDTDIFYEKTGQPTICKSWNLSDDLGQIQYIFSDKTGTLTQNKMVFRHCSIGRFAYGGSPYLRGEGKEIKTLKHHVVITREVEQFEVTDGIIPSSSAPSPQFSPTKDASERFYDLALLQAIENSVNNTDGPNVSPETLAHYRRLNGFFTVLGLCHTVLTSVDPETGEMHYKSQSPDEAALVQAAADVGYVFEGREKEVLMLSTPGGAVERWELLNILEFSSARKRMSIVVRRLEDDDSESEDEGKHDGRAALRNERSRPGKGKLFLLMKGADNVVFERLREDENERVLMAETERHLNEFANEGLRTLTLAFKALKEDYYHEWSERYHEATLALDDREEKVEAVCSELEQDLRLLGATAIEDKLQDGVPETIADLKKAGIKVWVATGDKLETAIAIGRSTNLVTRDSNLIIVRGGNLARTVYQQMKQAIDTFFPEYVGEINGYRPSSSMSIREGVPLQRVVTGASLVGTDNGERPGGFVLVIDGAALLDAFEDELNKATLLRLGTLCEAVICCRVSPLQKALIVKLVKDGHGVMTLAIGDGANDVSMIQAADVGVGISGEEGLQAVNSSDYAIAQFRFLKKLLLVHGHWSYSRNGIMISNFFYKNIVPTGVLWWYQFYSAWSGWFVFDYTYILFWNSIFTLTPVIGIGLFDRFLDADVLMKIPELYRYGREGTWFGQRRFWLLLLDGVYQSVIIFFFILYTYFSPTARKDGYDTSLYEWSTTAAVSAVTIVNIYAGLDSTAWTWWLVFAIFIGTFAVWVYTVLYSLVAPGYAVTRLYGNYYYLYTSAYFWLCIFFTFCLSLLPRYVLKAWRTTFDPDDLEIVRCAIKKGQDVELSDLRSTRLAALRRPPSSTSAVGVNDSQATLETMRTPHYRLRRETFVDMATGLSSVDRGFDFAMEENGVAMQRMQTNLSERRASSRNLPPRQRSETLKGKGSLTKMFSIRRKPPPMT